MLLAGSLFLQTVPVPIGEPSGGVDVVLANGRVLGPGR